MWSLKTEKYKYKTMFIDWWGSRDLKLFVLINIKAEKLLWLYKYIYKYIYVY